jgi:predicted SnoaL-like aldol condensation-catalyzing enzyme
MLCKKQFYAFICAAMLLTPITALASEKVESDNKKIVRDFYDLAFNQRKPQEAADKYIGSRLVQHNPTLADGKDAFVAYFQKHFEKYPESHVMIKQAIADDDLVVLHVHSRNDLKDPGLAVVDIFRVEKGKIVEHWDVIQAVPAVADNLNTMF